MALTPLTIMPPFVSAIASASLRLSLARVPVNKKVCPVKPPLATVSFFEFLSCVSAKLNYLVVGEDAGSKLEKAKKINTIKVISEDEFLGLVNNQF